MKFKTGQYLYEQIANSIRKDIDSGLYRDRIPATRDLSAKYKVNRFTVNKAISILMNEGMIYPLKGKGIFIFEKSDFYKKHGVNIGLVLPTLMNPFYARVAELLQMKAAQESMSVFLTTLLPATVSFSQILAFYKKRGVNILIVSDSVFLLEKKAKEEIEKSKFSVIVIGEKILPFTDGVDLNIKTGAKKIIAHLLQRYGPEVGHISGCLGDLEKDSRYQAYLEVLNQRRIKFDPRLVIKMPFTYRGGYERARRLLQGKRPPKAIFAFNDFMALGAENAAKELGLNIPNDVGIGGFDDSISLEEMVVPTTTVRLDFKKIAVEALKLAERRLLNPKAEPKITLINPLLVIRKSSLPAK